MYENFKFRIMNLFFDIEITDLFQIKDIHYMANGNDKNKIFNIEKYLKENNMTYKIKFIKLEELSEGNNLKAFYKYKEMLN